MKLSNNHMVKIILYLNITKMPAKLIWRKILLISKYIVMKKSTNRRKLENMLIMLKLFMINLVVFC